MGGLVNGPNLLHILIGERERFLGSSSGWACDVGEMNWELGLRGGDLVSLEFTFGGEGGP